MTAYGEKKFSAYFLIWADGSCSYSPCRRGHGNTPGAPGRAGDSAPGELVAPLYVHIWPGPACLCNACPRARASAACEQGAVEDLEMFCKSCGAEDCLVGWQRRHARLSAWRWPLNSMTSSLDGKADVPAKAGEQTRSSFIASPPHAVPSSILQGEVWLICCFDWWCILEHAQLT